MSEKYVIVLGDKTSHGGTVITGDDVLSICDKPAARLGDKVTCPLHGPNEIIEGFHTVMLEPNKTLAYEGCKTACGATLIAGEQTIVTVDTTSLECLVFSPETKSDPSQEQSTEKLDEAFILFVSTVYGEAAGQSEAAWQAIGSVIMNRVGNKRFANDLTEGHAPQDIVAVIKTGGFDAYKDRTSQFLKAKKYLENPHENTSPPHLKSLILAVKPIYNNKHAVTTEAVMYYSPKAQHALHRKKPQKYDEVPDWDFDEIKELTIPGMNISDDFLFYRYKKSHEKI